MKRYRLPKEEFDAMKDDVITKIRNGYFRGQPTYDRISDYCDTYHDHRPGQGTIHGWRKVSQKTLATPATPVSTNSQASFVNAHITKLKNIEEEMNLLTEERDSLKVEIDTLKDDLTDVILERDALRLEVFDLETSLTDVRNAIDNIY